MPEITEKEETLREFCVSQAKRLSVFRGFGFLEAEGRKEIRIWLERKGDRAAITALMEVAVMLEEMPTLADLARLWADQHPPQATALRDCEWCAGTGFEIVKRGEREGAKRCRCGGVPVADATRVYESPRSAVA